MDSTYKKIFSGSFIVVQLIVDKLKAIGISPVVKDETESGRLAGFMASIPGFQDLYVSEDEVETARPVVESVTNELEADTN
ncbi:putative signal transducing protein [Mangrovimonas spongiae]|uniref:DUF2007 domain-containing protein n=1 Tax=Mangrovimonas spongiae TaxID=2494697 RepID=A0A428JVK8_9FLAO|nr:DUF2007 domain-containing protein [Mangrovimonas spongiae]RSK38251.1 DUF2007 domain-containing protein [Mangrovimonas spongiae]